MTILPKAVADRSLPTPNVYFCTVLHAVTGVHSFYVAADDSRAALSKVRNHCATSYGFRPYRSTTDIKLRRFLLGDYLENPQGLQAATDLAQEMGERSTVEALTGRMADVQSVLQEVQGEEAAPIDADALEAALAEELRALERA